MKLSKEVERESEELERKSKEVYYDSIIKEIRETAREVETLALAPEIRLYLKEEMLSIIASSNYKSKKLVLENFSYETDLECSFRVDISENFEVLILWDVTFANTFISSRSFPKIKRLELKGDTFYVSDILKSFPSLECLVIRDVSVLSFKHVTDLSSLCELYVVNYGEGETCIEDINLSSINEKLKTISLLKVKADNIKTLINYSKNLEHLALEEVNNISNISFKDLTHLSFLDIMDCNLKNFNFDELSKNIKDLRLVNTSLSGDISIKGFHKLENLHLKKNNISSLELIDLYKIKILNLNKNPLIKLSFQNCSCLQNLDIPFTVQVLSSNFPEITNTLTTNDVSIFFNHDELVSFMASRRYLKA